MGGKRYCMFLRLGFYKRYFFRNEKSFVFVNLFVWKCYFDVFFFISLFIIRFNRLVIYLFI